MDIIRNLLYEGFSPDALVRRGATPRYVTAVCEDIVEGTKRRKALWLRPRDDTAKRLDSPEVEVSVTMTRNGSHSSESSAEIRLIEKLSPPKPKPQRLVPSSSWMPQAHSSHPSVKPGVVTSHAMPIDSFKPNQSLKRAALPVGASSAVRAVSSASIPSSTLSSTLQAASLTIPPVTNRSVTEGSASPPAIQPTSPPRDPSVTAPAKPIEILALQGRTRRRSSPSKPGASYAIGSTLSPLHNRSKAGDSYEVSAESSASSKQSPFPGPSSSSTHFQPSLAASSLPISLVPESPFSQSPVDLELAAKHAILESRRKALESMKLRRAAAKKIFPDMSNTSRQMDTSTHLPETPPFSLPLTALENTIEQQVAELEREVMNPQMTLDAMDIDEPEEDEPEEGEIPPSLPKQNLINLSSSNPISASVPIMGSQRGQKRPNAEDLDNRPKSVPSRSVPPSKRRVFGGVAQRPNRLLIYLDDSDSDGGGEDDIPELASEGETQRLLAEKEEGIRLLKEKIAARMRVKGLNRLKLPEDGRVKWQEGSPTPSENMAVDLVQEAVETAAAEFLPATRGSHHFSPWPSLMGNVAFSADKPELVRSGGINPIEVGSKSLTQLPGKWSNAAVLCSTVTRLTRLM